jgi:glycerophosphoryl diester phosphodiesterase
LGFISSMEIQQKAQSSVSDTPTVQNTSTGLKDLAQPWSLTLPPAASPERTPAWPLLVPQDFRIIAHRGASGFAPENTRAAFDLAVQLGVSEIELDVQLTSDGQVVVCHDSTLERYGHGNAVVERLSLPELLQLDMGGWYAEQYSGERMPILCEVLAKYRDSLTYHIELKGLSPELPAAALASIRRAALEDCCIVTSFSLDQIIRMRAADPNLRLAWLVPECTDQALAEAEKLSLFQLCLKARCVTAAQVQRATQTVPEVRIWGIEGETLDEVLALTERTISAGCGGATIDWPILLKKEGAR